MREVLFNLPPYVIIFYTIILNFSNFIFNNIVFNAFNPNVILKFWLVCCFVLSVKESVLTR